jgi:hypothetical protein
VKNVIEMIRNTTTLPAETIRDIQNSYLDFLMERGSTISVYNKIEAETHGPITIRAIADSKKRSAEEAEDKPSKQLRIDGIVDPTTAAAAGAISPVVSPAVSPYAAQPPYYSQGQWNTQGYAGYPAVSTASAATAQQVDETLFLTFSS